MARRAFLSHMAKLAALPFFAAAGSLQAQSAHKSLKILMKRARRISASVLPARGAPTIPPRPHSPSLMDWRWPKPATRFRSICSARRSC